MSQSIDNKQLASIFHVFADENRLMIIQMLLNGKELSVSDIGKALNQSQPAVSHHLSLLKVAGVIDFRRDGRFNRYKLSAEGMEQLLTKIGGEVRPISLKIAGLDIKIEQLKS